jgi:serine/threonine protein kinase
VDTHEIDYQYQRTGIALGRNVELVISNNSKCALKRISKLNIESSKRIQHILNEKKIHKLFQDEKNVVRLIHTFNEDQDVCFLLELVDGPDLGKVISNHREYFPDAHQDKGRQVWVRFYVSEILVALQTLHLKQVIHRDIKPENLMVDQQGHIKLIDFGFAKQLKQGERTYTNCGTVGYTAPEII